MNVGSVPPRFDSTYQATLRSLHAQGWTDVMIAPVLGFCSESIRQWRKRLGLPSNGHGHIAQRNICKAWREALARKGAQSLGELRSRSYSRFAADHGLPTDLKLRQVQIVLLLARRGRSYGFLGLTRQEICRFLGMPYRGHNKALYGDVKGGSYLGDLRRRDLVIYRPGGKGHGGRGQAPGRYTVTDEACEMLGRATVEW
jgi:hypothetical protein